MCVWRMSVDECTLVTISPKLWHSPSLSTSHRVAMAAQHYLHTFWSSNNHTFTHDDLDLKRFFVKEWESWQRRFRFLRAVSGRQLSAEWTPVGYKVREERARQSKHTCSTLLSLDNRSDTYKAVVAVKLCLTQSRDCCNNWKCIMNEVHRTWTSWSLSSHWTSCSDKFQLRKF